MEAALKQRLVGAAVIIALAVIFIPMLFDSSGNEKNQSMTINIPDEPQNLKQKVINIDTGQFTNNSDDEEKPIAESAIVDLIDNSSAVIPTKPKVTTQETIIDIVDNTEHLKQDAKDKVSIIEKPTQKLNKTIDSVTEVDTKNSYRVKYGVFSQQKNAEQLKAKIINAGYSAIVEKNQGEELFTVFSKQLSTESKAQKVSESIQKINLNIGKPTIQSLNELESESAEILLDTGWIVQIGSFASKENSLKLRDKIRKKGYISFVDEIKNSKNQKRYRVRVGPYATRQESIDAKGSLKKSMSLNGLVKPHEKQKVILK